MTVAHNPSWLESFVISKRVLSQELRFVMGKKVCHEKKISLTWEVLWDVITRKKNCHDIYGQK